MAIEIPVCDPLKDEEALGKNCKKCDPYTFDCTECHQYDNRYIKNGICECDAFFVEENGKCVQEKGENILAVS